MTINDLKTYLSSISLPKSIRLDQCTFINNVDNFVDTHIAYIERLPEKAHFPYKQRLLTLIDILENEENNK